MSSIVALAKLHELAIPVIRTNDAAALWRVTIAVASKMLARLAAAGHLVLLKRGLWLIDKKTSAWAIHPYLTDPSPSYISMQTALYHHGMIDQIPSTIHLVSTAKTSLVKTPLGVFAVHQVTPVFFTGYNSLNGGLAQIATPEKALVDFLYFRPAKSRSFRGLPELDVPKRFSRRQAKKYAALIVSDSRRKMVLTLLDNYLSK